MFYVINIQTRLHSPAIFKVQRLGIKLAFNLMAMIQQFFHFFGMSRFQGGKQNLDEM
jgi:hypothetical protein